MLSTEEEENNKWKKDIVDKKLIDLDERARDEVCDTFQHSDILAWSLYDLNSADFATKHFFELNDNQPIYHFPRRVSHKRNQIVEEEFRKMLEAGIIVSSSSAWCFPVVIASKKMGSQDFLLNIVCSTK